MIFLLLKKTPIFVLFFQILFINSCIHINPNIQIEWPTKLKKMSRGFSFLHNGIDIPSPVNSSVFSAHKGQIVLSTYSNTYGNYIIIKYSDEWKTLYAHLNKNLVKKGDFVKAKHKIGLIGSTGRSTGPHLHFELIEEGVTIDPLPYLPQ